MTSAERQAHWRKTNSEKSRENVRRAWQKMRDVIYDHYGRVCRGCGESDPDTLTLDHINNDGAKHRRGLRNYRSRCMVQILHHEWKKTGHWRTDIQTLCANCQLRKVRGKPLPLEVLHDTP
jgi:hypothetical protein